MVASITGKCAAGASNFSSEPRAFTYVVLHFCTCFIGLVLNATTRNFNVDFNLKFRNRCVPRLGAL